MSKRNKSHDWLSINNLIKYLFLCPPNYSLLRFIKGKSSPFLWIMDRLVLHLDGSYDDKCWQVTWMVYFDSLNWRLVFMSVKLRFHYEWLGVGFAPCLPNSYMHSMTLTTITYKRFTLIVPHLSIYVSIRIHCLCKS